MENDWRAQLAAADARIDRGRAEMAAGGDDRARALAAGVAQRHQHHGGQRGSKRLAIAEIAGEAGITVKSVDTALAKVNAGLTSRPGLYWPVVWEKLAAAELADVQPLTGAQWGALAELMRDVYLDEAWIDAPGDLLAQEVEDLDPDELPDGVDQATLAQACRSWSRSAALAVLDTLARGEHGDLPAGESP